MPGRAGGAASFNRFAIVLGFGSLGFVAAYPFMKRITSWPQAVLGLAFSWGGADGLGRAFGSLAWPRRAALCAPRSLWTMGYDTIYAVQDIEDDAIAGIKSTARLFGAARSAGGRLSLRSGDLCLAGGADRAAMPGPSAYARARRLRGASRLAGEPTMQRSRPARCAAAVPARTAMRACCSSPGLALDAVLTRGLSASVRRGDVRSRAE